ncbi:MAG TPA: AAC(3) family N-acetyltransferase [Planctomycetota bacterium]|nr:AAC(3) family N-acetyltransferase [Planctomycetota bacterium]
MTTRAQLAEGFSALGLSEGASVLVHSSLKSLGWVEGGAAAVVDALLDATGPTGTVMVPNLPFRGSLTQYLLSKPTFDVRTTPSLMGAITEALRLHRDARRSLHSSHSVAAVGRLRDEMTRSHELDDVTCGPHSAYFRNAHCNAGRILMIGTTLRCMTTFHSVEEMNGLPYLFSDKVYASRVIDYAGKTLELRTRGYAEDRPVPRDFPAAEPLLLREGLMRIGTVAGAECRLMDARGTYDLVERTVRKDPYFLLAERPA